MGIYLLMTWKVMNVCDMVKVNLEAYCMIVGYTEYWLIYLFNIILLIGIIIISCFAIWSLRYKKMRHVSSYFLNFFSNAGNSLFTDKMAQIEHEKQNIIESDSDL